MPLAALGQLGRRVFAFGLAYFWPVCSSRRATASAAVRASVFAK
jgi:hypothetical protein